MGPLGHGGASLHQLLGYHIKRSLSRASVKTPWEFLNAVRLFGAQCLGRVDAQSANDRRQGGQ